MGAWSYEGTQDLETGELVLSPTRRRGPVEKVAEAAAAIASPLAATLPEAEVEARATACASCAALNRTSHGEFCTACECPEWRMSELSVKRMLPLARCPLGRWPSRG